MKNIDSTNFSLLRGKDYTKILSRIPKLLGFYPQNSLILVGIKETEQDKTIGPLLRVGLDSRDNNQCKEFTQIINKKYQKKKYCTVQDTEGNTQDNTGISSILAILVSSQATHVPDEFILKNLLSELGLSSELSSWIVNNDTALEQIIVLKEFVENQPWFSLSSSVGGWLTHIYTPDFLTRDHALEKIHSSFQKEPSKDIEEDHEYLQTAEKFMYDIDQEVFFTQIIAFLNHTVRLSELLNTVRDCETELHNYAQELLTVLCSVNSFQLILLLTQPDYVSLGERALDYLDKVVFQNTLRDRIRIAQAVLWIYTDNGLVGSKLLKNVLQELREEGVTFPDGVTDATPEQINLVLAHALWRAYINGEVENSYTIMQRGVQDLEDYLTAYAAEQLLSADVTSPEMQKSLETFQSLPENLWEFD